MSIALVTGSNGLVGSDSARVFASKGMKIIGIDNDARRLFFGKDASTKKMGEILRNDLDSFEQFSVDIRDMGKLEPIFATYGPEIEVIIHAAAQPSHDWAAKDPMTDFSVNAVGTLNLLELARRYCPEAVFIFTSTNKVYGDTPNRLPFVELDTRWEISSEHPFHRLGIDETMSIDQSKHSLFGSSKLAADILVQEYGRYFGMNTGVFRGGCLTGPHHAGAQQHGFLSYLVKCTVRGIKYTVYGHKAKQVRDNIHSLDLANMFWHFSMNPRGGEVYNVGGGAHSNCSMMEAIALCETVTGKKLNWDYDDTERLGDHRWYISNIEKFRSHYPAWDYSYSLSDIIQQIALSVAEASDPNEG